MVFSFGVGILLTYDFKEMPVPGCSFCKQLLTFLLDFCLIEDHLIIINIFRVFDNTFPLQLIISDICIRF